MSLVDRVFVSGGLMVTPFHLLDDSKIPRVLEIRNDDRVRVWMDNQDTIAAENHLAFCRSLRGRDDAVYCLVESDDEIVGSANLTEIDFERKSAQLGVYKNPMAGSKNAGRALMNILEDLACMVGVAVLHLRVRRGNGRAISLYHRCGYLETGTDAEHVFMKKELEC